MPRCTVVDDVYLLIPALFIFVRGVLKLPDERRSVTSRFKAHHRPSKEHSAFIEITLLSDVAAIATGVKLEFAHFTNSRRTGCELIGGDSTI
uniref:Uncharacterized protein n=1 Tax=Candidatus Nitrotoga fabula TaxID=2182327 RepID=A0A2X0QU68_9PROT|nr:protein of unknown function [Candidatus Nitrotoga fabula]